MKGVDENTKLKHDFNKEDQHKSPDTLTNEPELPSGSDVDVNEAIESAGCGLGTALFSVGPFLLFCLEGGEIIVLSIVGLMVRCEWELTTFWVTALQGNVLIGMLLSSFLFSGTGDKYGRKPVVLVGAIGVTLAGLACGLTTQYWQLFLLRGLVGVFIGLATGPGVALTAEISTIKFRGALVSLVSLSWGFGAALTSGLAYFVVEPYGWRGLMIATALLFSPSIVFLSAMGESPRHDAKKGNWDGAENSIQLLAKLNCVAGAQNIKLRRSEPAQQDQDDKHGCQDNGCLTALKVIKDTGRLKDFLVLITLSTAAMLVYYIVAYSMPRFLNEGYCTGVVATAEESCTFERSVLFELGIISLFEPCGVAVAVILMELIGRKKTFQASVVLLIVVSTSLYFCMNKTYSFILFTVCKFAAAQIGWSPFIFGSEYFPTEIRAFVIAICVSAERFGGLLGIVSSQFVYNWSPRMILGETQLAVVVVSLCLFALKKETMGAQID